jgi:hypothetical protein
LVIAFVVLPAFLGCDVEDDVLYPSGQAHSFTGAMCVLNLVHE